MDRLCEVFDGTETEVHSGHRTGLGRMGEFRTPFPLSPKMILLKTGIEDLFDFLFLKPLDQVRSVENYSVVTKEKLQYFEAEIRPAYVS